MHDNARMMFEKYAVDQLRGCNSILEIGPDSVPSTHEKMLPGRKFEYLDLHNFHGMRRAISEYEYDINNDEFDAVISSQVVEHVRRPWTWMQELARCVRPGGLIITVCPVNWPYHEWPVDCWRIWPDGMMSLHNYALLETVFAVSESLDGQAIDTVGVARRPIKP